MWRNRAETQAPLRTVALDQRLQPVKPARAGALDVQWQLAALGLMQQGIGNLIGTHGTGYRITGNIQLQHAESSRQPLTKSRRRSGVRRACTWPSSSSAGEQAQAPRQ
ncbi:hypothetical protein D9M73_269920 [compost metagenome]